MVIAPRVIWPTKSHDPHAWHVLRHWRSYVIIGLKEALEVLSEIRGTGVIDMSTVFESRWGSILVLRSHRAMMIHVLQTYTSSYPVSNRFYLGFLAIFQTLMSRPRISLLFGLPPRCLHFFHLLLLLRLFSVNHFYSPFHTLFFQQPPPLAELVHQKGTKNKRANSPIASGRDGRCNGQPLASMMA